MANVFRGDQVNAFQGLQGPEGNIFQIADRGGHHIQGSKHRSALNNDIRMFH